ncbi:MAG: permease [Firmicutes bacterium]|nr:permease [Bacillota bacterium]
MSLISTASFNSPFAETFVFRLLTTGFGMVFIVFAIIFIGYLIGKINIKGVALGSAGVFVSALAFGILFGAIHDRIVFTVATDIAPYYREVNIISWVTVNERTGLVEATPMRVFRTFGLAMFIGGIGLIAGPTFFRNFKKKFGSYVAMGLATTTVAAVIAIVLIASNAIKSPAMATGLLMGALSTTPGLSAAQDVFSDYEAIVATANGVAYPLGVLGVVLFVQLVPKILKKNMDVERKKLTDSLASSPVDKKEEQTSQLEQSQDSSKSITIDNSEMLSEPIPKKKLITIDKLGLFVVASVIIVGMLFGSLSFQAGATVIALGTTGGVLLTGLIVGHFGKIGRISLKVPEKTSFVIRELGLIIFLATVGFEGGLNFLSVVADYPLLFLYGGIITLAPMIVAFLIGRYAFKLDVLNNLGSVTGGMTSTPALGALIYTAKTEDVGHAYAATYPIALFSLIFVPQIIALIF